MTGLSASELSEGYHGLPVHFVDSNTRPSKSESPAYAYPLDGLVSIESGMVTVFNGPVVKFLAVYSYIHED